MKFEALKSFTATFGKNSFTANEGEILELTPEMAAALGPLVKPVVEKEPAETAVSRAAKKREKR
jgi:hypothetical protein